MIEDFNRDITAGKPVLLSRSSISISSYINYELVARIAKYFMIWGPTSQSKIDMQIENTKKYCRTVYP